jgi:hypothetical protein
MQMRRDTNFEVSRAIGAGIGDREITRQLQRHPAFALPTGSEDMFRHLLEKLDHVAGGDAMRSFASRSGAQPQ